MRALRNRQVKELLAINGLLPGTPMLLTGDEMDRNQGRNNNACCQNNPTELTAQVRVQLLPALPDWTSGGWRRVIDTARESPHDLVDIAEADPETGATNRVDSRSAVVLLAAALGAAGSVRRRG